MNKKIIPITIGTFAIALITTTSAYAFVGNSEMKGQNFSEERHEEMQTIFESNDYESWKTLMSENEREGRVLETIDSQEKFDKFVEAQNLRMEGNDEEAKVIMDELGLQGRMGEKGGDREGRRSNSEMKGQNFSNKTNE